jgi:hypothetical protein
MEEHARARRRHQTRVVAERRLRLLLMLSGDVLTEHPAMYYAKRTAISCDCRRRRKGRPKCGTGCCWDHDLRPAVRARIDIHRLLADLRAGRIDPEDIPHPQGRCSRSR